MKKHDESEWELVDSLPNERKKSKRPSKSIRIPKRFLIGAGIGIAIVILVPPVRIFVFNLYKNLIAYWWAVAVAAAYWFIKRKLIRR